jgi:hypothetical protein
LNKSRLWLSAAASLAVAVVLAGCGTTYYFGGRQLPPSKLVNRVLIAIQNPSALSKGALEIVDAFYDERSGYNGTPGFFSIAGYGGNLPISIQNMPEEQRAAVYSSGDGSLAIVDYQGEKVATNITTLPGLSSSVFLTRNQELVFAANQTQHVFSIADPASKAVEELGLPGVYRVSVNPGATAALAFVQNSNYFYYPRQLTNAQSLTFSGGPSTWPKAAVDCEPQNSPIWCLFQAQSPDHLDATGNYYGAPLTFDRPVKAIFSADGSTAYILNCGPECGGTAASVSIVPVGPLVFQLGQQSGLLPCNAAPCSNPSAKPVATIPIPGGANNALIDGTTLYVIGQKPQVINGQTYWGGYLSLVNLANNTASSPVSISDGIPNGPTRMILGDDNTLWIGTTKCNQGVRFITNAPGGAGCLTMYDTATNTVQLIEPYLGDATGIAAVTSLHKIYAVEGGQVYIYNTKDGSSIDNQYVTVTGTAWDVAYMDGITDTDNTVY